MSLADRLPAFICGACGGYFVAKSIIDGRPEWLLMAVVSFILGIAL